MIEGPSGLLHLNADVMRPEYEPSKRLLTWPNGSVAQVFSAEEPDGLRGPQFEVAWCDEIGKRFGLGRVIIHAALPQIFRVIKPRDLTPQEKDQIARNQDPFSTRPFGRQKGE